MENVFISGGPMTWVAMAGTVVLYAAIFREVMLKRSRYAAALYSAVGALLCFGLAGTAAGFVSAGAVSVELFPAVVSVASIPLVFTTVAAAPALILIGSTLGMRPPSSENAES